MEIFRAIGFAEDTVQITYGLGKLAVVLNLQRRFEDAARAYEELDKATEIGAARRDAANRGTGYIATLYNTNRLQDGIAIAERLLARQKTRIGDQHIETALTRGWLAIGLARSGRDAEAMGRVQGRGPDPALGTPRNR